MVCCAHSLGSTSSAHRGRGAFSRGRRGIEIFTTDKQELRENVIRSGNRELAMELTQFTRQSTRRSQSRSTSP